MKRGQKFQYDGKKAICQFFRCKCWKANRVCVCGGQKKEEDRGPLPDCCREHEWDMGETGRKTWEAEPRENTVLDKAVLKVAES